MYKKGYFPQPRTQAASKGMDLCWHNTVILPWLIITSLFLNHTWGSLREGRNDYLPAWRSARWKTVNKVWEMLPEATRRGQHFKSTLSVQYLLPWPVREWIKRLYSIKFLSCETKAIKRFFNVMLSAKSCQHIKANLSIFNSYLIRSHS